jgi:flagellar assembly factor FliW
MIASLAAAPVEPGAALGDVAPRDIVTIRDGLPGFEDCRRFVLISSPDLSPLVQLQGVDGTRPSFLAIDPRHVLPAYDTALAPADRSRIAAGDADVLLWLAIVRLDGARVLVNLRAPVVVNPRCMLGLQVVAAESPYDTHHELLAG